MVQRNKRLNPIRQQCINKTTYQRREEKRREEKRREEKRREEKRREEEGYMRVL